MSDRELQRAESLVDADDWTDDDIGDAACVLERCVAELRERRAADLGAEDRWVLGMIRNCIDSARHDALKLYALIDRLLNGGK